MRPLQPNRVVALAMSFILFRRRSISRSGKVSKALTLWMVWFFVQ